MSPKSIELAQRGYKNPTALYFAALNEFESAPPAGALNWARRLALI
jgi:hypothetical protein